MNLGPGTVVVPSVELARYHGFTMSLADLELPAGSRKVFAEGTSVVQNLNVACASLRPEDEWVWLLGDDHVFQPDTLTRLLMLGKDVVVPLCVQRKPPWPLVHYPELLDETGLHSIQQFDDLPDEPFQVTATGSAMLIQRYVLEAVDEPWFETSSDHLNEDLSFCGKVRAEGFEVWVDPNTVLGHLGTVMAVPTKKAGVWGLVLDFGGLGKNTMFLPGGVKPGTYDELEPKRELQLIT